MNIMIFLIHMQVEKRNTKQVAHTQAADEHTSTSLRNKLYPNQVDTSFSWFLYHSTSIPPPTTSIGEDQSIIPPFLFFILLTSPSFSSILPSIPPVPSISPILRIPPISIISALASRRFRMSITICGTSSSSAYGGG